MKTKSTNGRVKNRVVANVKQREATMRMVANESLLARSQLLSRMIDPRRDLDTECGYPSEITIENYKMMYDREGLGTRVVQVFPEESWSTDPRIVEDDDAENTPFEAQWEELNEELDLFHYLARVDELSGIGTFGVLLIGIDDGLELSEPIASVEQLEGKIQPRKKKKLKEMLPAPPKEDKLSDESSGQSKTSKPTQADPKGEKQSEVEDKEAKADKAEDKEEVEAPISERRLLFLRPFDQSQVDISSVESDPKSPRYGQPTMYDISFSDPYLDQSPTSSSSKAKVHWTRVLHVADNRKSSELYGVPRMRSVFNRLMDLRKTLGGSAEMFWRGAFPGYSFEVDGEAADVEIDADAMRAEFEKYSQGLQRYLALTGVSAKSLAPQVADPSQHVDTQIKMISITIGCPIRVFMGNEAGHLASTQDEVAWNKRMKRRREKYITPKLIKPFIKRLQSMKVLVEDVQIKVEWEDLNAPSDADIAETAFKQTDALSKYIAGSVDQVIPPLEYLIDILGIDREKAEAFIEAAEERVEEEAEFGHAEPQDAFADVEEYEGPEGEAWMKKKSKVPKELEEESAGGGNPFEKKKAGGKKTPPKKKPPFKK